MMNPCHPQLLTGLMRFYQHTSEFILNCPLDVYYITLCQPLDPNVKESIITVL